MPSKSRAGKGKHPHQSKKSKAIRRQEATRIQPHKTVDSPQPAAVATKPAAEAASTLEKTRTIQYPFIVSELRRIGILAGIILVILIILALILS
jgi:hypothetical protein